MAGDNDYDDANAAEDADTGDDGDHDVYVQGPKFFSDRSITRLMCFLCVNQCTCKEPNRWPQSCQEAVWVTYAIQSTC